MVPKYWVMDPAKHSSSSSSSTLYPPHDSGPQHNLCQSKAEDGRAEAGEQRPPGSPSKAELRPNQVPATAPETLISPSQLQTQHGWDSAGSPTLGRRSLPGPWWELTPGRRTWLPCPCEDLSSAPLAALGPDGCSRSECSDPELCLAPSFQAPQRHLVTQWQAGPCFAPWPRAAGAEAFLSNSHAKHFGLMPAGKLSNYNRILRWAPQPSGG